MGRGGQVILRDRPNVLHVRVEAPLELRLQRVRDQLREANRAFSTLVEERRVAQDLIAANDLASADYLKRFYGVDWSDPLLYDILINTSHLSSKLAAGAIIALAKQWHGVPLAA